MLSQQAFAAMLDQARRERHLSIRAVARIAGVPPATAQGWLNGQHRPAPGHRAEYLRLLAELGLELPEALTAEFRFDPTRDQAADQPTRTGSEPTVRSR